MSDLFPPIEPFDTFEFDAGDGHRLYVERCGREGGAPYVFLHGGPGSGVAPHHRRLFDPDRAEVTLFDQRGAGRSRPAGSIEANTTQHLIRDIEGLRARLGHARWRVVGGSWGATLALAYADAHPERVAGLALYGVFLCRQSEIDGFYGPDGPAAALFPEAYAEFAAPLTPEERSDPVAGYARLIEDPDPERRAAALLAWTRYEKRLSRITTSEAELAAELADAEYVRAHSRIENWYFRNRGFIDGDAVLARAGERLGRAPLEIVAARYDVVTPPATAWSLARAAPNARLTFAPRSGHSIKEPAVRAAFMAAIARL